jgi:hypothetical protein
MKRLFTAITTDEPTLIALIALALVALHYWGIAP